MKSADSFLFTEKYRPQTVADTVLPEELKKTFQGFVDAKNIPNLILAGTTGMGKTTIAMAMCDELGADYLKINGSKDGGIDTLNTTIEQFCSTVSLDGNRKYVILDEGDFINARSTQPALRTFIEDFNQNCGFIFTCNFKERILDALHSRCAVIEFKIPPKERVVIATQQLKRIVQILDLEKITYEKRVIAALIAKHFPDLRRVLNEIQRYGIAGKIDNGILLNLSDDSIKAFVGFLKDKDFTSARKWIGESEPESSALFRKLYDTASAIVEPSSVPQLVLILGNYQHKAALVADQQLNLAACAVEIMNNCVFK